MKNKEILGKADSQLKELVKPVRNEDQLKQEAEFLCTEHNSPCRRNSSVIEDDDILF